MVSISRASTDNSSADTSTTPSYELQVSPQFRTFGLGTLLLQKLSLIGKRWGMEKIMLTVLKGEESATPTPTPTDAIIGF